MPDTDLLFTPASDLAMRVRGGELSARELTELALERIEARNGELNAFIEVDAERALAAADAIEPGDSRGVRRRPDRDQGRTRRSTACA